MVTWPPVLLSIMVKGPCGTGCSLHGCCVAVHWGLFLITPNREGDGSLQVQQVKQWVYWNYTERHGWLKVCLTKKCKERVLTNAGKKKGKEPGAGRHTYLTHRAMGTGG